MRTCVIILILLAAACWLSACGPTQVGPTSMPAPTIIIEHVDVYLTVGPNTVNASATINIPKLLTTAPAMERGK